MDKDQKRINGIARGDRNALIELIADWKGPIHSYFYRSLSNYADAEDLTQQFFSSHLQSFWFLQTNFQSFHMAFFDHCVIF